MTFIEPDETNTGDRVMRYRIEYGPVDAPTLDTLEIEADGWTPGRTLTVPLSNELLAERLYMGRIQAIDRVGNAGLFSDFAFVEGCTAGEPPSAIVGTITMLQSGEALVDFVAPGDDGDGGSSAASYQLSLQKTLDDGTRVDVQVPALRPPLPPGSDEVISLGYLEGDAEYHLALSAVDECSNAGEAFTSTFIMSDWAAPDAVDDLSITTASETSVELAWTPACDSPAGQWRDVCRAVGSYRLVCANAPEEVLNQPQVGEDGFIRALVSGLPPESPQTCSVVALDNCITIDGSACETAGTEATGWTGLTPPAAAVVSAARLDETPEEITLSFTMPGDDGFAGTATRITVESGAWPLDVAECEPSLLDTVHTSHQVGGESVALVPTEGGTAAALTFTGFNSTTRYCFRVTVEDEAHAPAEGRESASQSAIVGVNYIDTEIPELVSSLDFALSTGEEVQTLDLSFRPPLDGPLMIPITEYALVVGSRTFGSVACSNRRRSESI